MYAQILYALGVILTLAVGATVILRRRNVSAFIVAAGAGANGCGHVLQALTPMMEVTENDFGEAVPPYFDFGMLSQAGYLLTMFGWIAFLAGLLWHFIRFDGKGDDRTGPTRSA